MKEQHAFPFSIQCRDLHERDAAAAWLISHGCLVHGIEDSFNGIYNDHFMNNYLYLWVEDKETFTGRSNGVYGRNYTFYENVGKLSEFFREPKEEIQVGDWVVALHSEGYGYTRETLYKVSGFIGGTIKTETDDRGSKTNGWGKMNFRKATDEEIEAHLRGLLPDWLRVGKNVKVGGVGGINLGEVTSIEFVPNTENGNIVSQPVKEYFNKHGKCLCIIINSTCKYPFGHVDDYEEGYKLYPVNQLPKINNYEGQIGNGYVKYGCATINIDLLKNCIDDSGVGNRKIKSTTLDSGVEITREQIEQIVKAYEQK